MASILTHVFDITIPRFNNVFTAAWLIYVGMQLVQRYKVKFDNWFVLAVSIMSFYSFALLRGDVHLNRNEFDDALSLTISSFSALYIVCFISKKTKGWLAKGMAIIGKDSFYIMGLHFLTFKLGSCMLNAVFTEKLNPAELMAPAYNFLLYVYFVIIGVFGPLVLIWLWRMLMGVVMLKMKI